MAGLKNKLPEEKEQPAFNPDGVPVPDEDFTEEEWQYILKRSRELIPDMDDYVPVGEPAW